VIPTDDGRIRVIGIVENLDRHALAFPKAEKRAGRRAIVSGGSYRATRGDFNSKKSKLKDAAVQVGSAAVGWTGSWRCRVSLLR
jgi:hypothetical protein